MWLAVLCFKESNIHIPYLVALQLGGEVGAYSQKLDLNNNTVFL